MRTPCREMGQEGSSWVAEVGEERKIVDVIEDEGEVRGAGTDVSVIFRQLEQGQ